VHKHIRWSRRLLFLSTCLTLLGAGLLALLPLRQASALTRTSPAAQPLQAAGQAPTSQSLLVLLLDRSTSLLGTDPAEYSASVAKVFADLWPGRMAVIFFSDVRTPLPQIGPIDLAQQGARQQIKNQIESQRTRLQGWTPTRTAIEQASQLLGQAQYPAGSQVVLITDGQPSLPGDVQGSQQIQMIEQQDTAVFSDHHIPVSTFGLGNQVPASASAFLNQVATATGGTFHEVTDPAQLAKPVLEMYASWLGLTFAHTSGHNAFRIDTYAGQVNFVAFLQNSTVFPVSLLGPNGQPVPAQNRLDQSLDIHYEFDRLAISTFNPAGNYSIQTSDPGAQTYALEQTRLRAELVSPTPQTPVYAGQPLTVAVALYDQNPQQHVLPAAGDAVVGLTYALVVHGKTVERGEETLKQGSGASTDLFSAQFIPKQTGTLQITISATYQYIPVLNQPQITLQVSVAPCALTDLSCDLRQYGATSGTIALLLALLLVALWILLRQSPFGVFKTPDGLIRTVGHGRSLIRRLLSKSTVFADELQTIGCPGARFDLRFKRGKQVLLVACRGSAPLRIGPAQAQDGQDSRPASVGQAVPLHNGERIIVADQPGATFYENSSRANQAEQAWTFNSFNI
jgi:hypothetical protein